MVQFCNKYIVGSLQKNSFWALEKWKMNFPCKENENSLRKHCLEFQDAPLFTIWDHLNKLCHECGHKIDHLAWKPLISTHDSSFLRTLFKNNFHITSLLFFLETWSHIMTQCEGFPIFWFFYWIFYARFKFDPLPTETAEICLFHERWIKFFYTQPFCQLCIKYVLVF